MQGVQHIEIWNRITRFKFDLNRNITIIRGDSGTGKTTLYNLVADYTRLGKSSGVQVKSGKPCVALTDMDWKNQLQKTVDSIVFVDEGADYLTSQDFAEAVKNSDNYYVIINRENLYELPYSVEEIYEIKTSGKIHLLKKCYPNAAFISSAKTNKQVKKLLTEDTKSGYTFFDSCCKESTITCETVGANSAVFPYLQKNHQEPVLVIADGAAFGAEIDRVMKIQKAFPDLIQLCLPESFEWLILKSGIIRNHGIEKIMGSPSEFIESSRFFSWERFFTALLIEETKDYPYVYRKERLHDFYLKESSKEAVLKVIPRLYELLKENK